MLCNRGGEADFVKLLDFGLGRESTTPDKGATETQILVGTPMFIAPERIIDPTCMDERSDIFSLGIVAFILLTGIEPHASTNSMDSLMRTLHEAPVAPSTMAPFPIPDDLDQLVLDCQARKPELRPQSVSEIIERLIRIAGDCSWTPDDAHAWWTSFAPVMGPG